MARGKAQFNGPPTYAERCRSDKASELRDFSDGLKAHLRDLYPHKNALVDDVWGHPEDSFVNEILAEARWVIGELDIARQAIKKKDLLAERDSIHKRASELADDLRHLSPDFERTLLNINYDLLAVADHLDELVSKIDAATVKIEAHTKRKPTDAYHPIWVEMAVRVCMALETHGIKCSATAKKYMPLDITAQQYRGSDETIYVSPAVRVLHAIGADLARIFSDSTMNISEKTWKEILGEAKEK